MGCSEGCAKRKVYCNTGLPQERRTTLYEQSNSQLMKLEKEEQMRPKVSRRRNIIRIRAKMNKIEKNKTIERINESKSWFFKKTNKIDKPLEPDLLRKKESLHTSTESEMRKKTSQWTQQKYKELLETTMKTYMLRSWKNLEEMDNFLEKIQPSKTDQGRNTKSKQTNYQQ